MLVRRIRIDDARKVYVPADYEAENEPVAAPDVLARILI